MEMETLLNEFFTEMYSRLCFMLQHCWISVKKKKKLQMYTFVSFSRKALISSPYWPPAFSPDVYPLSKTRPYPKTRQ